MAEYRIGQFTCDPPYPYTPTHYKVTVIAKADDGSERTFLTSLPLDCKDSKNKVATDEYMWNEAYAQVKADIDAWLDERKSSRAIGEKFTPNADFLADISAKKAK